MKKAIILVVVALVLAFGSAAAVFFGLGYLNPVLRYESRMTINKPRAEVWKIFDDDARMKDWLEGLESIELVSGEKGEPGSKYKLVIAGQGEKVEIYETMKEIRPEELYSFTLDAEPLINDVEVIFADKDGGTEMVQKEAVAGKTLVWRSLFYWLQSSFQANSKRNLENFKRIAEGQ
jgi:uncharacterized protein YndB with AHSA1/START domain